MTAAHVVTDHAVYRWLERVHGLGPAIAAAVPATAHDSARAEAGCRILGITVAEARRRILPDRLRPGINLGATAVLAAGYSLVLSGGRVVTLLTPEPRRRRPRYRAVTRHQHDHEYSARESAR